MPIDALDLGILAAYVVGIVALGLACGRGQGTAKDYLLGNRDLPWGALLASIIATETSAATFLSVPGLVFGGLPGSPGDLRFLQLPLGFVIGRIVAAHVLLPLYFRGELFTAYDALKVRFGPIVRGVSSALFLVMRTLADGLRLCLTAVVVREFADVPLAYAVVATGATTLVYSFVGGVRAVVWTDLAQFVVYTIGAIVAAFTLWHAVGGELGTVLTTPEAKDHLRVLSLAWTLGDQHTLQAGIVGGAFLSLGTHGTDQIVVQRYLCARSLRDAQRALVASGFVVLAQFALFLGIGFLLWTFYRGHAPARPFEGGDAVFADYIVHHLPPGVRGLVLGAVLAAAMSGSLNSSAGALVNDILLPLSRRTTTDRCAFTWSRYATLLFGLLQIGVGLVGFRGSVVMQVLGIAAFSTGILLGVFFLALLPGPTDERAALVALLGGGAITATAYFELEIASLWFSVLGAGSTFATGALARLVFARRPR